MLDELDTGKITLVGATGALDWLRLSVKYPNKVSSSKSAINIMVVRVLFAKIVVRALLISCEVPFRSD